jgi:hypothetical protein
MANRSNARALALALETAAKASKVNLPKAKRSSRAKPQEETNVVHINQGAIDWFKAAMETAVDRCNSATSFLFATVYDGGRRFKGCTEAEYGLHIAAIVKEACEAVFPASSAVYASRCKVLFMSGAHGIKYDPLASNNIAKDAPRLRSALEKAGTLAKSAKGRKPGGATKATITAGKAQNGKQADNVAASAAKANAGPVKALNAAALKAQLAFCIGDYADLLLDLLINSPDMVKRYLDSTVEK